MREKEERDKDVARTQKGTRERRRKRKCQLNASEVGEIRVFLGVTRQDHCLLADL